MSTITPNSDNLPAQVFTLGWREWGSLPELCLSRIKIKVDTGARTSALHAFSVEPFTQEEKPWVKFLIHPNQDDLETTVECTAPIKDERYVTDSGGHKERRYVIETPLVIGGYKRNIEITLTNRDTMKFRMLLGRTAMNGFCVVNPDESYLMGKPTKHKV